MQRRRRHFKSGQATGNERLFVHVHRVVGVDEGVGGGGDGLQQVTAVKITCGIKMRGCWCSPFRPRRAPRWQKSMNDYEKHRHAGQRRACVGHLTQSSRPQTVSAV